MKIVISVILGIMLIGCTTDSDNQSRQKDIFSSFTLSEGELEAYARLRNAPDDSGPRYERAIRVFAERNALAKLIASKMSVYTPMVSAEIKHNRNELLIKRYLENYSEQAVTQQLIEEFYNQNIEDYKKEKVKIAYIRLASSLSRDMAKNAKNLEKAKRLADRLRKKGGFSQAALKFSEDPQVKEDGGELGWIEVGGANHALASVAIKMSVGDISEPIETARGIYIITVLEGPVVDITPLEKVRDKIAYKLKYNAKLKEMERLNKKAIPMAESIIESAN